MHRKIIFTVSCLLIISASACFAGLNYYEEKVHKFNYTVEGEIEIKPDKAVFPIILTIQGNSYADSLKNTQRITHQIISELKQLDNTVFTASPSDFFKQRDRGKTLLDVSFWRNDENKPESKLIFNIYVNFKTDHTFWQRAEFLAEAHDFIDRFIKRYKEDETVSVYPEETYYEIDRIEQYREEIIRSIYEKAKTMADIIASEEKVNLDIRQVTFGQHIVKEILNFNRASLTINADIEFAFDKTGENAN
ncbi:hypothetical protein DENIS_2783 [Desulfonema ishimotonii]|uniref:SIMPL domain-containing protein n=2 Tax=Desulfonema ishimotonii TaxID=45657 RepID=A0A401FXX6_9BACT|nr:hypothetical protein DENIS_2783 [Desulfonema ishimotonii]